MSFLFGGVARGLFMPRLIETCQPHKKSCQCRRTVPCVAINRGLSVCKWTQNINAFPPIYIWLSRWLSTWLRLNVFILKILKILLNLVLNVFFLLSFLSPEPTLPEFRSLVYCIQVSAGFWVLLIYNFSLVQLIVRLTLNIIFHVVTFFYYEIPY